MSYPQIPNLRPSRQRHLPPDLCQQPVIDFCRHDLRLLTFFTAQLGKDHAPRVNNHAVAIAHALLVVPAHLGGGDHIRLRLDGTCPEEDLPVGFTCRDGEGRGVGEDVGMLVGKRQGDFGEAELRLSTPNGGKLVEANLRRSRSSTRPGRLLYRTAGGWTFRARRSCRTSALQVPSDLIITHDQITSPMKEDRALTHSPSTLPHPAQGYQHQTNAPSGTAARSHPFR